MSKRLYLRILFVIETKDKYFQQKTDATGKLGASALQKVTAALRMLANGTAADSLDEYIRLSESTIIQCLVYFCFRIIKLYGKEFLRKPNEQDLERILRDNNKQNIHMKNI